MGERIRENIQRLREQRGWSRPQLAMRCDPPTSGQQIERLEKGQRGLEVEWIERIARGFNVDPSVLMADEENSFILSPEVADELALVYARFVLRGDEPNQAIVQALSILIQEMYATFAAHPQSRRDPQVVRPVADILARKLVPRS